MARVIEREAAVMVGESVVLVTGLEEMVTVEEVVEVELVVVEVAVVGVGEVLVSEVETG